MGVIITKQEDINEYFKSDKLNQSTLKGLIQGFDKFIDSQKNTVDISKKSYIIIGSAVDCILTGEEDAFDKLYHISNLEIKPSEAVMNIVDMVYNNLVDDDDKFLEITTLRDCVDYIGVAIEKHEWRQNWKFQTRINKILELGNDYFEDLKAGTGKQVISSDENIKVNEIVFLLKNNFKTKTYFDRDSYMKNENVDIYYQLPIYFKYKDVDCKALLDMVIVFKNPDTKKIESIIPVDLKTMSGHTMDFLYNLKKWRYDIQGSFYTEAVKSHFETEKNIIIINLFEFVVESTTNTGNPLVFKMSYDLLRIGKYGREELLVDNHLLSKKLKGFDTLIDEYKYYSKQEWKEDKINAEAKGPLKLDWNGVNIK